MKSRANKFSINEHVLTVYRKKWDRIKDMRIVETTIEVNKFNKFQNILMKGEEKIFTCDDFQYNNAKLLMENYLLNNFRMSWDEFDILKHMNENYSYELAKTYTEDDETGE